MVQRKMLQDRQSYSFRQYFELPYEPDDILAEFGYGLTIGKLTLPQGELTSERLQAIRQQNDSRRNKVYRIPSQF